MNLTGIEPITEENKKDWINWIKDSINYIDYGADRNDYGGNGNNRTFGTDLDDLDEARKFLAAVFLTLQQNTLTPKNVTV